ncbi:MAG: GldG family protein [Polyangiaceae bacterium]|nr:GldG family protein [Polyangiaceae bacterium]
MPTEKKGAPRVGKSEKRAHIAAGAILVATIVLMLNYLSFRHFERFDWTSDRLFSVSERTVEVLRDLDRQVEIYLFMSPAEPNYADVQELMQAYRSHSDRVRVRQIDPHRQSAEYRVLAQRFGIATLTGQDGTAASDVAAIVVAGDRNWKITRDDLLTIGFDEGGARSVDVEAERALTGAIVEATTGRPTNVCATTGHGEWDLSAGGERGLSGVREVLERDNVEMRAVETLGGRAIPETCDALFVVSPERAFSAEEVQSIDSYLARGGNVFLALDPVLEGERIRPTGLEAMLRRHGIELDASVVLELDPERLLSSSPIEAFVVTDYGEHETTSRLARIQVPTVMLVARSVRPVEGSAASPIVRTTSRGYAERNLAELSADQELAPSADDVRGPVSLGVATEVARTSGGAEGEGEAGGRLVVVGDADFLLGEFLAQPQFANVDVLSGITGWVTHRRALISIAPRTSDIAAVVMTEGDLRSVMIRVLVLLPLAVVLLGFSVWWSRRA